MRLLPPSFYINRDMGHKLNLSVFSILLTQGDIHQKLLQEWIFYALGPPVQYSMCVLSLWKDFSYKDPMLFMEVLSGN